MAGKTKTILAEYRKAKPEMELLAEIVTPMIQDRLKKSRVRIQTVSQRMKSEASLKEKLNRKNDKYSTLTDVTDLLGIRIICYFADDVDKVARMMADMFVVDWENSVDQRKEISPTNFGYLSLHYICSLPEDKKYPEALLRYRFEIQMRSSLQNIWAEIEHDLGYKNDFGVPKNVQREFAQIAGLLEVADKEFGEIRNRMNHYEYEVRREIRNDKAHDLPLDAISLREFMNHSRQFRKFMQKIVSRRGNRKIVQVSPEGYLENLDLLGVKTIGDLLDLLEEQQEHALILYEEMLKNPELDEIVSSIGLYLLCQARLVWSGRSERSLLSYFRKTTRTEAQAKRRVSRILTLRNSDIFNKQPAPIKDAPEVPDSPEVS